MLWAPCDFPAISREAPFTRSLHPQNRDTVLQYYRIESTKVFVPDSYGLPGRKTTEQTYTISGLCWYWCAFHLRYSVTGLREAHPNSIFSLAISVLEYYVANVSVLSDAFCLRHRARDPISVAFCFDRVTLWTRDTGYHFQFISAVHIWFISYNVNTHFFHGNIWTHNWPASDVSGFIAQLVEHRTGITMSRVQTPLKSWIFFRLLTAIA